MNRMIVMFVALFIGVSGSAFLMMQATNRSDLSQAGSQDKKVDNSPTKDDEGTISAVESKATFDKRDSSNTKSGVDGRKEPTQSSSGPAVKSGEAGGRSRRVASSSRPAGSSVRTSSGKTKRADKKQPTTSKPEEPPTSRWDEDLDKLQGTWQVLDAENNGESNRQEAKHYTWEIKDDKYTINCDGHFEELWSVKLNSGRSTKTIDGTHVVTGQKLMGIYEINDDTLKICYDLTGRGRPDNFTAGKGARRVVYILQRQ